MALVDFIRAESAFTRVDFGSTLDRLWLGRRPLGQRQACQDYSPISRLVAFDFPTARHLVEKLPLR